VILKSLFGLILGKASVNRKLYVFLFCLSLSILFWLLNTLSKTSSTQVLFDVSYINEPINKVILNELPKQLTIKIRGLGFDLMAYKLRINPSLVEVDLSRLEGLNDEVRSSTLASVYFSNSIGNQLGEQLEIKAIFPDSIRFLFDKRVEKKVEIIPNIALNFKRQFQLHGKIIVKPAVTTVSGPASVLDTLTEIYTADLILNELAETTTESIGFNSVYSKSKLLFNPEKVLLHIPVEKFTETTIMVSVKAINVPDSLEIKPIPSEVEVKFLIPLSKMVTLPSAKFSAEIDYNQMNDNFNHKLKVELTKYPLDIQSLTLNPRKVEYILKKRK
jgi:hypothetical protein